MSENSKDFVFHLRCVVLLSWSLVFWVYPVSLIICQMWKITEKQPIETVYCWIPTAMMDWSRVWILCCSGIWGDTLAGFTCTIKCLPAGTKCLWDMSYESRQLFAIWRFHIQKVVRNLIPGSQLLFATRTWVYLQLM